MSLSRVELLNVPDFYNLCLLYSVNSDRDDYITELIIFKSRSELTEYKRQRL